MGRRRHGRPATKPAHTPRTWWRWLFRLLGWTFLIVGVGLAFVVLSFFIFPPFGGDATARIVLAGLDEPDRLGKDTSRRSDSIILCAARLNGSGVTLISVPRDARVRVPGHGISKLNAAYARGEIGLLRQTLAQQTVLDADAPYYLVFDSSTVRAVVDAFGGVEVDVPHDMDYDDNWQDLHIHLKAGRQRLNGSQAVGFLRWRKDNHGGEHGDDFARGDRQRQLLAAMAARARSLDGMRRLPAVYRAFRAHTKTNLTLRQFIQLGWNARGIQTDAVPGEPVELGGVSYVQCDWYVGRQKWRDAQL